MEFNSDEKQEMKDLLVPASLPKRMIAYAMDSILLFILIQLIALFIPKLYDENSKNEFNNLINKVSILSNDERFDSTKMAAFVEESRLSVETYQMLISMMFAACFLPVIYFFCGDAFFRGQTLGKATFG
ncbi:MAG: RDD family protein, partial [Verrucomicrobiia bacterium]